MLITSITSRVLSALGNALIGAPQSLRMPSDFYLQPGDRADTLASDFADPKTKRNRIFIDAFRQRLFFSVGLASSALAVVLCAGLLALLGTVQGVQSLTAGRLQTTSPYAAQCAGMKQQIKAGTPFPPDQMQRYRQLCGG